MKWGCVHFKSLEKSEGNRCRRPNGWRLPLVKVSSIWPDQFPYLLNNWLLNLWLTSNECRFNRKHFVHWSRRADAWRPQKSRVKVDERFPFVFSDLNRVYLRAVMAFESQSSPSYKPVPSTPQQPCTCQLR
jgi:hypothetical protein